MQRLGGQSVQHQPEARRQCRERHYRVFVVEQAEVVRFVQDARDIKGHGLIELKRIRRGFGARDAFASVTIRGNNEEAIRAICLAL